MSYCLVCTVAWDVDQSQALQQLPCFALFAFTSTFANAGQTSCIGTLAANAVQGSCMGTLALCAPMTGLKGVHVMQVHGKYVAHNQVVRPAKQAQDDAVAKRLWDVSCNLTHLKPAYL